VVLQIQKLITIANAPPNRDHIGTESIMHCTPKVRCKCHAKFGQANSSRRNSATDKSGFAGDLF
jgi:hypothetical protein